MRLFRRIGCRGAWVAVAGCGAAAVLPGPVAAQTAYVTGSGRVVSIDVATGTQGTAVDVKGAGPVAITPNGATVYVTGAAGVTPIDRATSTPGAPIPVAAGAGALAITPDGRTLLVSSTNANVVTPIATATGQASTPIAVSAPAGIAITTDGQTAYVVTGGTALTPVDVASGSTRTPIALAHPAGGIATTPDGTSLIVAESARDGLAGQSWVQVVDLAAGTAGTPVPVDARSISAVAVAPDSRTAFLGEGSTFGPDARPVDGGQILPFDLSTRTAGAPLGLSLARGGFVGDLAVTGDGATATGVVPCNDPHCVTGFPFAAPTAGGAARTYPVTDLAPFAAHPQALTLVPSPSALFSAQPEPVAGAIAFNAAGSENTGGTVAGYAWQFGDGTTATAAGPTAHHTYAKPGTYTVTLTTTNVGGCAARSVYTGRGTTCTNSATAVSSRTVTIVPPAHVTAKSGTLQLTSRARRVVRGSVRLALRCAAGRACRGRLTLTTRARRTPHGALTTITCARATIAVPAAARRGVTLKVSAACRALLTRARTHRLTTTLTSRLTSGQRGVKATVSLKS